MVAAYGWDRALSWFCEVRQGGRLLEDYDGLQAAPEPSTVAGILLMLVDHGFLQRGAVPEAETLLKIVDEVDEIEDPGVKLAAEVLVNLRLAAAD